MFADNNKSKLLVAAYQSCLFSVWQLRDLKNCVGLGSLKPIVFGTAIRWQLILSTSCAGRQRFFITCAGGSAFPEFALPFLHKIPIPGLGPIYALTLSTIFDKIRTISPPIPTIFYHFAVLFPLLGIILMANHLKIPQGSALYMGSVLRM